MTQQEQLWNQQEEFNNSNQEDAGEQECMNDKAGISVLKNQSLLGLLSTRPPFSRSEKECRAIAENLKLEPYFESIARNNKTLLEISSWIEYRRAEAGEHIFRVHDLADCFYILLQGEVHLTFPEKEVLEVEIDSLQQNDANSTANLRDSAFYATAVPALHKNLSVSPPTPSKEDPLLKSKRLTRHQSLLVAEQVQVQPPPQKELFSERIVQVVIKGESFGDLEGSNRRSTNAIAKEECHLLLVRKQHFGSLSSAQVKSESRAKYDLLSSVPLFRMLYRHSLESLVFLMEEVKLGYNNTLYTEDEPIKHVFIILKGEFKLYKRVSCRKQTTTSGALEVQERRGILKNISYKTIELGEVLAYTDAYKKVSLHPESCVCKCQDGVVLRVDKNKFFKKLLSPDNNLEEILPFLEDRAAQKAREIEQFLRRYEGNHLFARYLHTPSARSRRINTESTAYRMRSEQKDELRKLSTASNNFFNEINKTVKQEVRSTRISVKRSLGIGEERGSVPSRIKDIIGIVKQEANYFNIRKPQQNVTLFQFSISKVPIHVKKKYEILFKKQKQIN